MLSQAEFLQQSAEQCKDQANRIIRESLASTIVIGAATAVLHEICDRTLPNSEIAQRATNTLSKTGALAIAAVAVSGVASASRELYESYYLRKRAIDF